ncbi:phage capsid protein [Roseospirillum parvum]|uniref:Phage capsid family protein n=1 Tax=Roseospirillum parvum TaxID=83401 RepID=A0A1G8GD62_9PROT|nr:phage capsid protein [Roseospirillum parvum]SDH92283.1 hypothetical protein SAMN05421742_1246 [Roseospirillum parvum]
MSTATARPFESNPALTAIAMAYRNGEMIADQVLPRVPVGRREFKYLVHNLAEDFTVPDTLVGRKGQVNQVEFGATEATAACQDYGLEDVIPQDDITNAPPGYNPKGRAVEGISNLIELDREVRAANLVFSATTYPAGYKETLAGTDQFSDFDNSSPLTVIAEALDKPIMRPNILVIGQAAWTVLRQHPQIVKAVQGNSGDAGMASRQQVAEVFELEEVLVGRGWVNTARRGQPANMQRVWGKHLALLHRNKTADTRQGATFGMTPQLGGRLAGSWHDRNVGLRGGEVVRAGESVVELITASALGYFFENAAA